MRRIAIAGTILASVLAFGAATDNAIAMPAIPTLGVSAIRDNGPLQQIHFTCRCARDWPRRQYWQWDHHPIWDDPWRVLKPNFWGSPEPHLVPADIWACKWHLPSARPWTRSRRWHARRCRTWRWDR